MTPSDRPSLVEVRNAAGTLIAVIDPVTRTRRNVSGAIEGTLSPQGWSLNTRTLCSWPGHGKPAKIVLAPVERTRDGRIRNRDRGRRGQGLDGAPTRKTR